MRSINKTNVKETNIFGKTLARLKQMHYLCIRNQNKCKDENIKQQQTALNRIGQKEHWTGHSQNAVGDCYISSGFTPHSPYQGKGAHGEDNYPCDAERRRITVCLYVP